MKKEITTKQMFFKELTNIIEKLNNEGLKETTTISLIYQVAFGIIERTGALKKPFLYNITPMNIEKEIIEKYNNEILKTAYFLIYTIQEDEAFNDLMSDFIESSNATNKRLGQFFTPNDISKLIAALIYSSSSIAEFEEEENKSIADPTCGSGSLILGSLQSLKNIEGFTDEHYQSVDVYMNDIDVDLAKIAFFQVVLNSICHMKPLGKIFVEAKNVITEYKEHKNQLIFMLDINDKKVSKKSNEYANKELLENV